MADRAASSSPASTRALLLGVLLAGAAAVVLAGLAGVGASDAFTGPPPPANLTECRIADEPALRAGYDEWSETLLDTEHTLGHAYVPPDLVLADVPGRRIRLRSFVVPDLAALLQDAASAGQSITVTSGYRSYARQADTLRRLIHAEGESSALLSAARPGHSEHQLGTTVDLAGGAEWLSEHAWRFGFVMSYPPGRSPGLTCYRPETWHYRYFGRQRAAAIHASGLSPREWLWAREQERESAGR